MKLRPNSTSAASCVRCNAAFGPTVGQVRATCTPCATALLKMHAYSEYSMYRRTYYMCSTEGTSYDWLMKHGYEKEIVKHPDIYKHYNVPAPTPAASVVQVLEGSG